MIEVYLDDCVDRASRLKLGAVAHISELLGHARLSDLTVERFRKFAQERATEGAGLATIGQELTYVYGILTTSGPILGASF